MAEIYGHKWTSNYSSADSGTWREGLRGLTKELLLVGLRRCIHSQDPWPPSLPEFRAICFGIPAREFAVQQAIGGCDSAIAHRMRKLLTSHDWANRTTGELTAMLRGVYPQAVDEVKVSLLTQQYKKLLEVSVD